MLETVRTFTALSEEFVEESLRLWPVPATAAGIHDYDDRLPLDTPEGFQARGAWLRDLEQRLAASVVWEELPAESRVDFALLRSRIAVLRAGLEEIRPQARDPLRCLHTALDGVALLVLRPFAPLEERKEAIVARLMAMPEYLAAAGAGLGRVPGIWVEEALAAVAAGSLFVSDLARGMLRGFPNDAERIEHAGARAHAGLAAFQETLEREIGPRADGDFALGERWLAFLLEREHMLTAPGEALALLAREHVALSLRLLEEEAKRVDPGRPWREQLEAGRRGRNGGRAERPTLAAELARAHELVLARRLAPVPDLPLVVAEVPGWRRAPGGRPSYLAPAPFDLEPVGMLLLPGAAGARRPGSGDGEAGIWDPSLAAAREGWPGRHLQSALAIRSGSRLRRLAASCVFADGWAYYAEDLMAEEGFCVGSGTGLEWIHERLLAAARAVADVGLHARRMSLAQAEAYLAGSTALGPAGARAEARRLTRTPARALGGFAGRIQLLELREEARRRLSARYDRLDFHAALLAGGTLPPALLREELWARLGAEP